MTAPTQTTTALAPAQEQPAYRLALPAPTGRDLILQADNLNAMIRVSQLMSKSGQAVPRVLRNNEGACFAVTSQAMRWNMDPFALAQKAYTASEDSPIAYEGQAIIAALNNSPLLATRLSFEWHGPWEKIVGKFVWKTSPAKPAEGNKPAKKETRYLAKNWKDEDEDGLYIIVRATLVGETQPRELQLFLMQARVRNSPLWTEDPKQQLAYLAGRRWGRLHAPDVIMGVYTPDEIHEFQAPTDMGAAEEVDPVPPELRARAEGEAKKGIAAYQAFWKGATLTERALLSEQSDAHEQLKKMASDADAKRTVDNVAKPAATAASTPAPSPAPAASPAAAGAADADGEVMTYAKLASMITAAKEAVAVEIAMEWAPDLPADQQADLKKLADSKLAELAPKADPATTPNQENPS